MLTQLELNFVVEGHSRLLWCSFTPILAKVFYTTTFLVILAVPSIPCSGIQNVMYGDRITLIRFIHGFTWVD